MSFKCLLSRFPFQTKIISKSEPRRNIQYIGTIFPRLTMAYEDDLADAVAVAEFSLRLMQILTSVLREFLETNIASYPQYLRQRAADNINKMARQRKADDSFHGWDFLALANLIIYNKFVISHLKLYACPDFYKGVCSRPLFATLGRL